MRITFILAAMIIVFQLPAHGECLRFHRPVPGAIVASFSPTGRFSGHWGLDFAATAGESVTAAASGTVSFSGVVAGNETVTISHGGGLKTSYSYLSERTVSQGQWVGEGTKVGSVGIAHAGQQLHFSVRIGTQYKDPAPFLGCLSLVPARALRLVA